MDLNERRYLVDFEYNNIKKEHHDAIIIGSGIAGVYTALEISPEADIAILTKETIDISNSVLAQGGIAVSLDKKDSPELHLKDTLYAGGGLCDEESVWVLVNEAAGNIHRLCDFGVNFDKKDTHDEKETQELSLTREAAHSMNRIIHAGDTTGKEVCDKLISVVKTRENIRIFENTFVIDLLTENGKCKGVLICDENGGDMRLMLSDIVICATGGYGQLYSNTTNPEVATGDGISMAYRAGAELTDLEFIQFHPTVLYHPDNKSFLISEAVRGEGALLKNSEGGRFMPEYHQLAELAPRDVVSRAIFKEMKRTGTTNVYLDISFKGKEYLENRFPNIYKTCLSYGIDITKDLIPVAPAEHYCMGGIKADTQGRTNIDGFFACGECASNGIHGANRLASNSLLEGLVFGRIIALHVDEMLKIGKADQVGVRVKDGSQVQTAGNEAPENKSGYIVTYDSEKIKIKRDIQQEMTKNVGIIRSREGLEKALGKIKSLTALMKDSTNNSINNTKDLNDYELRNILLLSRLVVESALEREESRGAHYRADFSEKDDVNWKRHIIKRREV